VAVHIIARTNADAGAHPRARSPSCHQPQKFTAATTAPWEEPATPAQVFSFSAPGLPEDTASNIASPSVGELLEDFS